MLECQFPPPGRERTEWSGPRLVPVFEIQVVGNPALIARTNALTPSVDRGEARLRALGSLAAALLAVATLPDAAHAYVGPGAGFALLSSFMVVLVTAVLALVAILAWPFRTLYRALRHRRKGKPCIRRLIIVGLDGQDPRLTDRFLAEGKLPNFQKLAASGCYHRIASTYPSISPVAWSSFATGTHPAKHNIFDFLDRDRRTYLPVLSSAKIGKVEKFLKIGSFKIPLQKPELTLLRKSKPFWTILGEANVWSTVLRVPITFPPDRFYGAQLGAMSIPDMLGTQGTFVHFTTRPAGERIKEGGMRVPLANGEPGRYRANVPGPANMFREGDPELTIPMELQVDRAEKRVRVSLNGDRWDLALHQLSDWIPLAYHAAPGIKVQALCRLLPTELDEHVSVYMTPISIDPDKPAMPISHPSYYSQYLAKKVGPFCTLGLAEDTWALNEKITDDGVFLKQAWDIDRERQEMFFAALEKLRTGTLTCVFDGTDRIQHMFWRYLEDGHPAARGVEKPEHANAIEELYAKNDALVGKVMEKLRTGDLLMVLSDHGFTSFRRGVNLNRWLLDQGYLVLKQGADGKAEWLRDVDWSRTRAYALGLTGMFLNLEGRESQGIVKKSEAAQLKAEIVAGLSGLRDDEKAEIGINEVFETAKLYEGPYLDNAPDLIVGYNHGYRVSWDCATGVVAGRVFEDNVKAWSGDHCVDPRLVPGVFFCNRKVDRENPSLLDIAPTALRLFGLEPPPHMDGEPLFEEGTLAAIAGSGKS
jgi:predicted AlkP superfamily phosphohydrolase/phosphomutase